jgi:ABC-type polysaccharide/polyol phosphate export permease
MTLSEEELPTATKRRGGATQGFDLRGEAGSLKLLLRELLGSRELIRILARKEFFVRYRRASFGLFWAVALPLVQAAVLAAVLSRFVRFTTSVNYTVFVFAGTMAWSFFSAGITGGATSIIDNSTLSSKIYFPRLVFPLVTVLSGLYGLVVSTAVLIALTLATEHSIGIEVLLLVPAVAALAALTIAFAAVGSALQVYFRDVKWLLSAAVVPWFYITPVVYPIDVTGGLRPYIEANPATGVVELFRAATVGADPGWLTSLWWTLGWMTVLLVIGLAIHRRYDRVLSDLL